MFGSHHQVLPYQHNTKGQLSRQVYMRNIFMHNKQKIVQRYVQKRNTSEEKRDRILTKGKKKEKIQKRIWICKQQNYYHYRQQNYYCYCKAFTLKIFRSACWTLFSVRPAFLSDFYYTATTKPLYCNFWGRLVELFLTVRHTYLSN